MASTQLRMPNALHFSGSGPCLRKTHVGLASPSRRTGGCRAAGSAPFELHVGETTISIPFNSKQAHDLNASINSLMQTFADKRAAERPKRWKMMEYKHKGDPATNELEYLEVFCNPNAHQSAFDAKVLVTIRSKDGVKITTEARLSALKADIDAYTPASA